MPANDTSHLQSLFTRFDVKRLGEGDAAAGANLLAAMACSLANIQRPGSCLITSDGETIAVGTSLIVSGGRSVSMISEKVLAGLATRQNNFVSHLGKKVQSIAEESQKTKRSVSDSLSELMKSMDESLPDRLFQPWTWHNKQGAAESWSRMVETPAEPTFEDVAAQPMVYVTGITAGTLGPQLERSHLGRPFMHVGVVSARDFASFEQICPTIMDGRITNASSMENVRGTVMVTDSSGALYEAVKANMPHTQWLLRLLWLVDGDAGPEPGKPVEDKALIQLDRLAARYEAAMTSAWGERLNCLTTGPAMIADEFPESQARWMAFLKALEPECPGISGTARNLYATLGFGLSRLVSAMETTPVFKWCTRDAELLARFLVQRMVNARAAMLHSAEDERMRNIEASFIRKLGDGPQSDRELQRRSSRLNIDICRKALHNLEGRGSVALVENKWQRVEPSRTTAALSN
jgi:hypothetical protein